MTAAVTIGLNALGDVPGLAVDWASPIAWIDSSSPTDVVGAILRLIGLVISWWVLITTVLYYAAGLVSPERRPQWLSLVTLPPIRRVIDQVLATSLALSIATAPVGPLRAPETRSPDPVPIVYEVATDGIPVPHIGSSVPVGTDVEADEKAPPARDQNQAVDAGQLAAPDREGSAESADGPSLPPGPPVAKPPTVVSSPTTPVATTTTTRVENETTYTVVTNDNLWDISAAHLEAILGARPVVGDIDDYWRTVISANRGTLRSGDPNLIYPGELITLPLPEISP
jgi:hypothetical protein